MSEKRYAIDRQITTTTPWMAHVAGRYYISQVLTGSQSANLAQPAANTLIGQPFFVPVTATYTGIAIHVTTAAALTEARLGIYNDNTGVPGSLVLDAGTVATTSTGAKEITISQSLSGPAWYWVACVTNSGTPLYSGCTPASNLSWLGVTTTTGTNNVYAAWTVAFTYAALPDPFTGGGALSNVSTAALKIMLKI